MITLGENSIQQSAEVAGFRSRSGRIPSFVPKVRSLVAFDPSPRWNLDSSIKSTLHIRHVSLADTVKTHVTESATRLSESLGKRVSEIANLRDGWDGEGALAVKPPILADAVALLERFKREISLFANPCLVPTFNGHVQIEWHNKNRSLDLEATADGWAAVGTLFNPGRSASYYEAEFAQNDFGQLKYLYRWWAGDEVIWPSQ